MIWVKVLNSALKPQALRLGPMEVKGTPERRPLQGYAEEKTGFKASTSGHVFNERRKQLSGGDDQGAAADAAVEARRVRSSSSCR